MAGGSPAPAARGVKVLVVNADDFGQSDGVTRGIAEAFERGIVTSASMMVRWPAASAAARYARAQPDLALGLHLDFGEWALCDGEWVQLYETADVTNAEQVRSEAFQQLDLFRDLVGAEPTHVDSHQHVHLQEPIRSAATEIARLIGIPLRHCSPAIAYCGEFYGQDEYGNAYRDGIEVASLIRIFRHLRPGITELACHPGYAEGLTTMYRDERTIEVHSLCNPAVRLALGDFGVELKSFRDMHATRLDPSSPPKPA
jgi:predicted glycoside hydrolase/deacetylase ChbG (UPF0249 family)